MLYMDCTVNAQACPYWCACRRCWQFTVMHTGIFTRDKITCCYVCLRSSWSLHGGQLHLGHTGIFQITAHNEKLTTQYK